MHRGPVASAAHPPLGRFEGTFPGRRAAERDATGIPAATVSRRGLPCAGADTTAGALGHPIGPEGARLPMALLPVLTWRLLPHGIAVSGRAGGRAAALALPGLH
jgi:hypothetical protein